MYHLLPSLRVAVLAASLLVFVSSRSVAAQSDDTAERDTSEVAMYVQMPDSVVVTASRYAEPSQTTGRRVQVWTRRDIAEMPITTVDQLLEVTAGLDVRSRGAFGVQSDLSLRGSTFNGVLLLVDGARVNDPMTGHFLMDIPIPLPEIERIEVLRGPATALYGPDALGGVVQIFTRAAMAPVQNTENGVGGDVIGQYGDYSLYGTEGQLRVAREHWRISVAGTAQGSNGQPITNDQGDVIESSRGEERTDFERYAGTAAAKTKLGDGSIYARIGIDDRDFSAYHYYAVAGDTARESTQTLWAQIRAQGDPRADTRWTAQVASKLHDDNYRYNPQASPSIHTSRLTTVQAEVSRTLSPEWTVNGGVSGQVRGIDSNTLGDRADVAGGVFASARYRPTKPFVLNGSLRLDGDPLYGLEPTPQLFASYSLSTVTLRAGVGRAVRAPNYVERYIDLPTTKGSPDLNAERSWSAEAGTDIYVTPELTLRLTGFGRRTTGLIDYAKVDENDAAYVARNLNEVETLGLETEASFRQTIQGVRVLLDGSYTLMDQTLTSQRPVADARYALSSPRHMLQGRAAISYGQITGSVNASYLDRTGNREIPTDHYGLIHVRLAYGWQMTEGKHVAVSAEVRNLRDREYSDVLDAPMPGRTFLVSLRFWL
ncbi:TonB-dependent receptor [Longibacter salinarum]|uniref:TonB-dependent receptor n=1 Tax=Longibacter salinarum TaxID=1850348 RepID=A0A2A8CVH2_9BACT|nr:TonB-dependent receptor [Longibacter salinarum]PEN12601.1 TonB-dependent receptor [Longibacter salinarum]